jgi:uncharacterized iron-regulated membrane protein
MKTVVASREQWLPTARKTWLTIHLWLGLTVGAALGFIGFTGSVLVFNDSLLKMELAFDPFAAPIPSGLRPSVDEWIANAHRTYQGLNPITYIGVGHAGDVRMLAAAGGGKNLTIIVNPGTGLPLGKFVWQDTWSAFVYGLHGALTTSVSWRGFGRYVVGWIGLVMIVSMATGLYLWWPRNRKWSIAFKVKRGTRGRRRLLDLHNIFSVYFYVPLFILAFTGVHFVRSDWIDPVISLVSVPRTFDPAAYAQMSRPGSCEPKTTPTQAVAVALARFPSAKFAGISIPTTPAAPYTVLLAQPNNIGFAGQTQVLVERECPIILSAIDGEVRVAAEIFQAVIHPLHHDLMLGWLGRAMVFVAGLLLPAAFVTGLLLWLDKRKNKPSAP